MIAEDVRLGWIVQAAQLAVGVEQALQSESLKEGAVSLANKRVGYANAIDETTGQTFGGTLAAQDKAITSKYVTFALIGAGTLVGIYVVMKIISKKG